MRTFLAMLVVCAALAGCGGGGSSGGTSTAPTPTVKPDAPTNLVATAQSSSAIALTWQDVSNEASYRVERLLSGTTFTIVATVAQNTTTYTNTGLAASTIYVYRIVAVNSIGDSLPSTEANATTQAAGGGGGSGTWTEQTLPSTFSGYRFHQLWASSATDVFVSGLKPPAEGVIVRKSGTTWTEQTLPVTPTSISGLFGFSATSVYAIALVPNGVSFDLSLLRWNGTTWSIALQKTNFWSTSYFAPSATDITIVGMGGAILQFNGTSGTDRVSGTTTDLYGVWGTSNDRYAVGGSTTGSPVVLRSTNSGVTWTSLSIPTSVVTRLRSVNGTSASTVFITGDGGVIMKTTGNGLLATVTSGTTDSLAGPFFLSATHAFALGLEPSTVDGSIQETTNGGTIWTEVASRTGQLFNWATPVSSTTAVAVGGGPGQGIIYRLDAGTWTLEPTVRDLLLFVFALSATDVWAVGENGLVLRRQ